MLFKNLIDETLERCSKKTDDAELRPIASKKVNLSILEVAKAHRWTTLKRTGQITVVPNYTAGTVSVTNGSAVVAGSGTAFTSDMEGRYFRLNGGDNWYRITDVTGQTLTLEADIVEDTASGKNYEIWKRYYPLPPDFRVMDEFDGINNKGMNLQQTGISAYYPQYEYPLTQEPFRVIGRDEFVSEYSAGTITATKDSNIVTGTGTLWIGTVLPGSIINFSSQDYRVKRVSTDTKLVMENYAKDAFTGNYTITVDSPLSVQLKNFPDKQAILQFSYTRHVYNLVNEDKDRLPFTQDMILATLDFSEAYMKEYLNKPDWPNLIRKAQGRLITAISNERPTNPPAMQFPPLIPPGMGR